MRAFFLVVLLGVSSLSLAKQGSELYQSCIACHGANGDKIYASKVPAIAGRTKEEILKLLKEYKEGTRNSYAMGSVMQAQVKLHLGSEEKLRTVAEYIANMK